MLVDSHALHVFSEAAPDCTRANGTCGLWLYTNLHDTCSAQKHTRLITLMYGKSHSVTIPFAQSLLITCPRKAISNPGRKYEVPLKQDKVLTSTKGPSVITVYLLLLKKLRHLVAFGSWRLTGHPSTRFPILHGSLRAGPPLVLSRAPQSAIKGIPSWGVHNHLHWKDSIPMV